MQENKPGEEICLCIGCLDFPFSNIDNKKLLLLHENENNLTTDTDLTKFSITCSICLRKLGKSLKDISCNCCKFLVHRRCSKLNLSEIRDLSKAKKYIWECLYCKKEKFPLVDLHYNELEQESFNPLYSCKCLKNTDFTTEKYKNVFDYTPIYNREDEKSILNDTFLNHLPYNRILTIFKHMTFTNKYRKNKRKIVVAFFTQIYVPCTQMLKILKC